MIVFFSAQTLFSTFINDLLHKDVTLSSRSYIWENAKRELMNERPFKLLFGLGTIENNNYNSKWITVVVISAVILVLGLILLMGTGIIFSYCFLF